MKQKKLYEHHRYNKVTNEDKHKEAAAAAAANAAVAAAAAAAAAAVAASGAAGGGISGGIQANGAIGASVGAAGGAGTGMAKLSAEDSRMTLTKVVYRLKKWKHLLGCRVFRAPSRVPLQRSSPYLAQVRCYTG